MAVTSDITKIRARVYLNKGLTPQGTVSTVSFALPTLNPETWDDTKAFNVYKGLENAVDSALHQFIKSTDAILYNA